MWSKILKPAAAPTAPRNAAPSRPVSTPVRPSRVLQSSRVPQQLSFEFRRG
jgi:hypothetical protein